MLEEANESKVVEAALSLQLGRQVCLQEGNMVKYARDPDNSTKSCKVPDAAWPWSGKSQLAAISSSLSLLNHVCSCRPEVPIFVCISRTLESPPWL